MNKISSFESDSYNSKQRNSAAKKDVSFEKFEQFFMDNVKDTMSIESEFSREEENRYHHFQIKSVCSSEEEEPKKFYSKSYTYYNNNAGLDIDSSSESKSYSDSMDSPECNNFNGNGLSHDIKCDKLLDEQSCDLQIKNASSSTDSMIVPIQHDELKYKVEETQDATPELCEGKSNGSLSYSETPESNQNANEYDFLSQYLDRHIKLKDSLEGRNKNMKFELEINAAELSYLKQENKDLDKLIKQQNEEYSQIVGKLRSENDNLQSQFFTLQKEHMDIKKVHDEQSNLLYSKLNELENQQKEYSKVLEVKDTEICILSRKIDQALTEVKQSSDLLKEEQESRVATALHFAYFNYKYCCITEMFNELQLRHDDSSKANVETNKKLSLEIEQLKNLNK